MMSAPQVASVVTSGKAVHEPKRTIASPTKFAKPGRPQPASIAITSAAPRKGICRSRPPSFSISSVPVCARSAPLRPKVSAARKPCATITTTAPVTPTRLKLAMPRKMKPMCATLELPMSRFKFFCRIATRPQ